MAGALSSRQTEPGAGLCYRFIVDVEVLGERSQRSLPRACPSLTTSPPPCSVTAVCDIHGGRCPAHTQCDCGVTRSLGATADDRSGCENVCGMPKSTERVREESTTAVGVSAAEQWRCGAKAFQSETDRHQLALSLLRSLLAPTSLSAVCHSCPPPLSLTDWLYKKAQRDLCCRMLSNVDRLAAARRRQRRAAVEWRRRSG